MAFHVPEKYRVKSGLYGSDADAGNNGAFAIKITHSGRDVVVYVIASDGEGWEHVSVSMSQRIPPWEVMCRVKQMFWDPEDCVVQYHPPEEDYVNMHKHCLHLWRPMNLEIPRPPAWMVGIR